MKEFENNRVAVLIDAENVPAIHADSIFEYAGSIGQVGLKEMYGSGPALCSWTEPALRYVIHPSITLRQTKGKNTSDIALTIGAMDLLVADSADTVVIVSSDSDFSALAVRLRRAGKCVIGMGEGKSNAMWKVACTEFVTLEQKTIAAAEREARKQEQIKEQAKEQSAKSKTPAPAPVEQPEPEVDAEEEALRVIRAERDENGWMQLDVLRKRLIEQFPGILKGIKNYEALSGYFAETGSFEVAQKQRGGKRGRKIFLIREIGTGKAAEENDKPESDGSVETAVREKIARMLEEKNGRMPISAMFPELSTIPGYRSMQKRSGKKPQQYMIDTYGDMFKTEDINGGLWTAPVEAAQADDAEKNVDVNDVTGEQTETISEAAPEVIPAAAVFEAAPEEIPETAQIDIRPEEPEAEQPVEEAVSETAEPEEDPVAVQLRELLIEDGRDAEIAAEAAKIMTENNMLQAYNKMRRKFGNVEGNRYYNEAKVLLHQIRK